MKKLRELKSQARDKLRGHWIDAAAFEVLWLAMFGLLGYLTMMPTVFPLVTVLLFALYIALIGPLHYVSGLYFTRLVNGRRANLSVFRELPRHFARNLAVTVYQTIFTIIITFIVGVVVIWAGGLAQIRTNEDFMTLCFVVEGILVGVTLLVDLYFAPIWLILAESPKMDAWEAIKKSAWIMCNHEGYLMLMILSFAGWYLLAMVTWGLGLIFVLPYYMVCKVLFYQQIRPGVVNTIKEAGESVKRSVRRSVRQMKKTGRK